MADSVATRQSRPPRVASKKRRQATVSSDTENKLARAARSAQRLAQLSSASRDDSTLDLFPDDPTRATLEAMNIDIRQGTLHGFELPDVVLAAVGAIDAGDGVLLDAKAARRAPRSVRADEPVPVNAQLSGLEIEPAMPAFPAGEQAAAADAAGAKPPAQVAFDAGEKPAASARETAAPPTSAMAAATVARSVTALRQAAEPAAGDSVASSKLGGSRPAPQRFAATFAKAATASREAAATGSETAAGKSAEGTPVKAGAAETGSADATEPGEPASPKADAKPLTNVSASTSAAEANAAFATPWREAPRAEAAAAALRAAPELDRARATAFADTVDALYGVIADQRRAATDHSRRMKWMLSIVVGALLATVAIGITQTLLLMRLTRETTAQQQRIEQMMQNQQAAMASLLDTHIAVANAAAANGATAAATTPAANQAAATATTARGKRGARALHEYGAKAGSPG
ncbi:hypothetical protein [Paraburkholderia ginsengisoli]|uniref:Cell wall surface anchor family protein n=1 Tax=Paraburkholderia ginsengisoli TaxID=311231 RepID=A0A7T4N7L6_9BURK|nr:hypothetical protein [Paraburkholderia ginsengisoli]QQC66701.1 hypothetical protein I6I06_16975 [Paraburkholderia ginsengisoli]